MSSAASSSSAPSAAPAAASAINQPTGQQQNLGQACFTDGLHSIFSFLTMRELCTASRSCLGWYAAGSTQPPLRIIETVTSQEQLAALTNSRRAWHIDQLHVTAFSPHDISSLLPLCSRLPHLTRLRLEFHHADGESAEETMVALPHTLRELDLRFTRRMSDDDPWTLIDSLFARVCHAGMPPLSALRLHIDNQSSFSSQIPASTLCRLLILRDSLVEFVISFTNPPRFSVEVEGRQSWSRRWTQEHIDVFRQLTRLEKLDPCYGRWSDEELIMLGAEPAPVHLHHLVLHAPPETAAACDALARLPITEMQFDGRFEADRRTYDNITSGLSFLGRMTSLESLTLGIRLAFEEAHTSRCIDALADVLASCTRLTRLHLKPAPITDADLCRVLPLMPKLRDLAIHPAPGCLIPFGGLSFLSTVPHLAHTLERLEIEFLGVASPIDIEGLNHLYALSHPQLHLHLVIPTCGAPIGGLQLALSRPEAQNPLNPLMAHFRARGAAVTLGPYGTLMSRLFVLLLHPGVSEPTNQEQLAQTIQQYIARSAW